MELRTRQAKALESVVAAFFPSLEADAGSSPEVREFWQRDAGELALATRAAAALDSLPSRDRQGLLHLLDLLASPLLGVTWGGPPRPFQALDPAQRLALLTHWRESPVITLRRGFHGLRKLVGFLAYTELPGGGNPNWAAIGYPGPPGDPPARRRRLAVLRPEAPQRLDCDVVVIGSGAGGGLAAGLLAEAGWDVILVEKGPYLEGRQFSQQEGEAFARLYEQGGALTTRDGGLQVLAGSCLGGGTTVNWTASLAPPEDVLEDWARHHDLPHLQGAGFREAVEQVAASIRVNFEASPDNPQNAALRSGGEHLGRRVGTIARNVEGCEADAGRSCGFCGLGCRRGRKRGTLDTWIRRAVRAGARILPDTRVERVRSEAGRVTGVTALAAGPEGMVEVEIDAPWAVVAAGALHTPALLVRSGLRHPELGRHLHLHPTVAVTGIYDQEVDPWHGPMMSAVDEDGARLDGPWGYRLETPPAHPGLMAMALPWTSGRQHKEAMLRARHGAHFIVLTRDREGGRVRGDGHGGPLCEYGLAEADREHLLAGVETAARIHLAAGARRVLLPHSSNPQISTGCGPEGLAAALTHYRHLRHAPLDLPLFSAHQMASCRMHGRADAGPVAPDGSLRAVRGLWVLDASALPSASGVNPMLTIMAFAWHGVHELLAAAPDHH